ncbi:WecB/TagA/CpsF family glycosyltransferase [Chitinophaga pollutisoli]|uniref:WecB/TagA/CpsF family glycosyltransferase n=1 Tax=Chitinophaga pollutisoli TaxID=3133966 RepID=A0ABZ2YW49_9BACT
MEVKKISLLNKTIFLFRNKKHVTEYLATNDRGILISLNVEAMASKDPEFTRIINQHIGYIDGVGLLLPLRLKGHVSLQKIPGVELWQEVIRSFPNKKVFMIGATEQVICTVADKFKRDFPNPLLGYRNGFFPSAEDMAQLREEITDLRPDIVLIALGQPRQEKLAEELMALNPALYICIGGSFDIYAGIKNRAPRLLIAIGAEWAYRLYKEPWRFTRIFKSLNVIPRMILAKKRNITVTG